MSASPQFRIASPKGPWTEQHTYESPVVQGKRYVRALFMGCRISKLRNATLEHCSLLNSSIEPEKLDDILGLTLTLECFTFRSLRLNTLAFDAMIYLLSLTKGNDEKRAVLRRLVSETNLKHFDAVFEKLETLGVGRG